MGAPTAAVVQMAEHFIGKEKVMGSFPIGGSRIFGEWYKSSTPALGAEGAGATTGFPDHFRTYSSVAERESHKLLVVGSIPTRSTKTISGPLVQW